MGGRGLHGVDLIAAASLSASAIAAASALICAGTAFFCRLLSILAPPTLLLIAPFPATDSSF